MSTKAEQCKYGCVYLCVRVSVLSCEGAGNWFFFFFFGLTKKANKGSCPWWWNRGCQGRLQHVLSLQRMAGGLSAHTEPLNHPLFLCVLMEQFHVRIALWSVLFILILFYFILIDVAGWGAWEKRSVMLVSRSTWQATEQYGGFILINRGVWSHYIDVCCSFHLAACEQVDTSRCLLILYR